MIYRIKCHGCEDSYIGESGRIFKDRFRDHNREPSPVYLHRVHSGHPPPTEQDVDILAQEPNATKRLFKEAMFIRVHNPILNRNVGKYQLPHIYDNLIKHNEELKI